MFTRSALLFLAVCAASTHAAVADVFTVGGSNPTHESVQEAVYAAHDGDVVLVRAAFNQDVVVSRGVAIVADAPGRLTWTGILRIQNVPAGSTVLISGFSLGFALTPSLVLSQNAGAIRIQDCSLFATAIYQKPAHIAVTSTASTDVAFLRSSIYGGQSGWSAGNGSAAISATDSTLTIQDCQVAGGGGKNGYPDIGGITYPGGRGGSAILFQGGSLVLQSSTVRGGNGGNGWSGGVCGSGAQPSAGGTGGDGLVLSASAVARAIGGSTLGGHGGQGGVGPCAQAPNGADGVPVNSSGSTWTEFTDRGRAFVAPRIVREGAALDLAFSGAPGEPAFLLSSPAAGHTESPMFAGVLLIQSPFRRRACGTLNPQGALSVVQTNPDLPVGATNDFLHLQSEFVDAFGNVRIGCTSIVVRLDASY